MVRTEKGNYVWDVTRLIELAKELPVFELPLSDIQELNQAYWHEDGGWKKPIARDIAMHAKQIYECNLDYPIILHANGQIMDGMHRCCKALVLGHKTIKAVKFEQDPEPHFINPSIGDLPRNEDFWKLIEHFGLQNMYKRS